MKSLGFSRFRQFIDEQIDKDEKEKRIRNLLDTQSMLLFFKHNGDIFGCGEDGRVVFARIKNPDSGDKKWGEEASFTAVNLTKSVNGEKTSSIFSQKDLDKIKVIDKEKAVNELSKEKASDIEDVPEKGREIDFTPDNFIHTLER